MKNLLKARLETIHRLDNENIELRNKLAALEKQARQELAAFQTRIIDMGYTINDEGEIQGSSTHYNLLAKSYRELEEVPSRLIAALKELASLQDQIKDMGYTIEDGKIRGSSTGYDSVVKENKTLARELNQRCVENQNLKAGIRRLTVRDEELSRKVNSLGAQRDDHLHEKAQLTVYADSLKIRVQQLEEILNQKNSEIGRLKDKNVYLQFDLDELRKSVNNAEFVVKKRKADNSLIGERNRLLDKLEEIEKICER